MSQPAHQHSERPSGAQAPGQGELRTVEATTVVLLIAAVAVAVFTQGGLMAASVGVGGVIGLANFRLLRTVLTGLLSAQRAAAVAAEQGEDAGPGVDLGRMLGVLLLKLGLLAGLFAAATLLVKLPPLGLLAGLSCLVGAIALLPLITSVTRGAAAPATTSQGL